jgi:lipoate-protein ligase A
MALDEAIATAVRREGLPPTLRLYGWQRPAASIGCFQRYCEIDSEHCAAAGISIVRRPTGGRGILHGEELTYSFSAAADEEAFSGCGLLESYRKLASAFSGAFAALGLPAETRLARKPAPSSKSPLCFASTSYGEITVAGAKLVGSAQRRWRDGFLQQGSIPFSHEGDGARRVFRVPPAMAQGPRFTAGIRELMPGVDRPVLGDAIRSSFEEAFGIQFMETHPSEGEEVLARELLRKYRSPEWTRRR